jgi:hypothetical protein
MDSVCFGCGAPAASGRGLCDACRGREPLAGRPSDPRERYEPRFDAPPAVVRRVRETSGLAVASLVLGIVAWFAFPILGAIGAVWTGHKARAEIRRTGQQGRELATAGLILGWAQLGLVALGALVAALVILVLGLAIFGRA